MDEKNLLEELLLMQIQVLQSNHVRLHRNRLQLIGPGKKGLAFCEVAQISQNKNYFQYQQQLTLRRYDGILSTKNFSKGVLTDKSSCHLVNGRRWYADHSNIIRRCYTSHRFWSFHY